MIDSVFEDKIHDYFTNKLNNEFSEFIKNPQEKLLQKIEDKFLENRKKGFETIKRDIDSLISIMQKLKNSIDPLYDAIKSDVEKAFVIILNDEKNKRLNNHDEEFQKFQSHISLYQSAYEKIYNNELDDNEAVVNNDIKKMHQSQNYFNKKKL